MQIAGSLFIHGQPAQLAGLAQECFFGGGVARRVPTRVPRDFAARDSCTHTRNRHTLEIMFNDVLDRKETFFRHKKFNLLKSQILSCFTRVPAHKNPASYPGRFSDPAIYQSRDVQINKQGSTLTADRLPGATKNFIWATKFRILVARSGDCNFCESCRLT